MDVSLLETSVTYLKGVGPNRAALLESELGIRSYEDLLHFYPNRYIDRTRYHRITELQQNLADIQIVGRIIDIRTVDQRKGKRLVATFVDDTGRMELVWFRAIRWIKDKLKLNKPYVAFGRVNWFNGQFSMAHPELEPLEEHQEGRRLAVQPIYPSTEKLSSRGITNRAIIKLQKQLLQEIEPTLSETLPKSVLESLKLVSRREALHQIHFPTTLDLLAKARYRLKFEEFLFVQLQLLSKKQQRKIKIKGHSFDRVGTVVNTFYKNHLPFELTEAQKRVIKEIRADLGSGAQMNRLLQGDVGSGKTIVALMAILLAIDNGFQTCLMAPTEILAIQHFNRIRQLLQNMDVSVRLLTGSVKKSERGVIHEELEEGRLNILIGTHALLEEKVRFNNLGLAVIDEQHRFGVAQRSRLWRKSTIPPHILVMTATPIPRTLAMSLYGDLDVSVIDELPPGRKQVRTVHRTDRNRLQVFQFLRGEIKNGRQVYIVYPLIKESEVLDYKDLMDGYESLSRDFPPPNFQISIVHGKMKPEDKDFEMGRFIKGQTQLMVATTVIEVGVDIPNASVMVIESAERFGLSQLHQLRGRVGRGSAQSYCILMTGHKLTSEAQTRIETMVKTQDGFEIAEVDLRLRGPGDLMGTQQSGLLNLKIADIVKDNEVLKTARFYAQQMLRADPSLEKPENQNTARVLFRMMKEKDIWTYIS